MLLLNEENTRSMRLCMPGPVHQIVRGLDAVVEDRVFADKVELVLYVRTSQCGHLASSLRGLGVTVTSSDDQPHSE